jgi:hypothetical protein
MHCAQAHSVCSFSHELQPGSKQLQQQQKQDCHYACAMRVCLLSHAMSAYLQTQHFCHKLCCQTMPLLMYL